jgi:hypothetical protein
VRYIVEQAVTGVIQSRDLQVINPKIVINLSGAAVIEFEIPYDTSADVIGLGIDFKAYGQYVYCEENTVAGPRKIVAFGITQPCTVDPETGNMKVSIAGPSSYLKNIPWLDNYNPIAIDPFAVAARIWNHVQMQTHGNIGITLEPASSGTLLLPGFGFDGTELTINFFAYFVRAADFRDSGDEFNKLARDIPFDYIETAAWNGSYTAINKKIVMSYPRRGSQRTDLAFRFGENVLAGSPATEAEIKWVSDVIVKGWFPGKVYSSTLSNADPTRFRRVIKEDDAKINSKERAEVWAARKLQRRQIPNYWSSITIDMDHPSAPFGTWELGDDIYVEGAMPWVGDVKDWHKVLSATIEPDKRHVTLGLMHTGAFNYDPITFPNS